MDGNTECKEPVNTNDSMEMTDDPPTEEIQAGVEPKRHRTESTQPKTNIKAQIAQVFPKYLNQLTAGCGDQGCKSSHCASNPANPKLDHKAATVPALKLSAKAVKDKNPSKFLCPHVTTTTSSSSSSSSANSSSIVVEAAAEAQESKGPSTAELPTASSTALTSLSTPSTLSSSSTAMVSSPEVKQKEEEEKLVVLTAESLRQLINDSRHDGFRAAIHQVGQFFLDHNSISHSFVAAKQDEGGGERDRKEAGFDDSNPNIDSEALAELQQVVEEEDKIATIMRDNLRTLCGRMQVGTHTFALRGFAVLLELPAFLDPEYHEVYKLLCKAVCKLNQQSTDRLVGWLSGYSVARLEGLVAVAQQYLTVRWYTTQTWRERLEDLQAAVKLLSLYQRANKSKEDRSLDAVPYEAFYNDAINAEIDIKQDYTMWAEGAYFCFCRFPFILDPAAKANILKIDARRQTQQAFFTSLFSHSSPYLVLRVRRDNLIQDALTNLQNRDSRDFKKPLKVKFEGEEGVDEGGVQKEFFQLLIHELFDTKYGMFVQNDEQNMFWFSKTSLESTMEFELIGILLGLAIYNGVILDLHFPSVVYKKLMGVKLRLEDFASLDKGTADGLQKLLQFDEAKEGSTVENTFCQTFSYTYDSWGQSIEVDLKEEGKSIALTAENREEYVELYVDFVLNKAVQRQYGAFAQGFRVVAEGDPLKLFRWEELELLICGNPEFDFEALQESARYEDGFTEDSQTVKDFWDIVHGMSLADQKKLLFFCTGSDRAPIKGLGSIRFVISKNGSSDDKLPISHTCFNHLLLPEYSSKQKLADALRIAIDNSQGFGMI
mmetsp:Transcript_13682/g.26535  ORF Transcript_13682/g.26535 Transcript_13682/m.26535 type:complete len:829 (-) Transcript_13682:59-2545(-)